ISLGFNLKALFGTMAVYLVVAIAFPTSKPPRWQPIVMAVARLTAGVSLPILGLLLGLWWHGGSPALDGFVADVVLGNLHFAHFDNEPRPMADAEIGMIVLALAGIVFVVWRQGWRVVHHPVHGPLLVSLAVISGVLWLPTTPGVARHAWVPVLIVATVYASVSLAFLTSWASGHGGGVARALVACAVILGIGIPAGGLTRNAIRDRNADTLRLMHLELWESCPGEPVLDGWALAVFRPPAYRYRT